MSSIVAGRVLDDNKHIVIALTLIRGVGRASAKKICVMAKIDAATKVKDLSQDTIDKIRALVSTLPTPIEGELEREVGRNIDNLKAIGCYRGIRHRRGLPMKARTKTNAKTRKRGKRKR